MGEGQGLQKVGTLLIKARASEDSLSIRGVRRGSWETQTQRTWEPVCRWPCMSPKDLTFPIVINGASQVALVVKNLAANAGDVKDAGLIPGLERYTGGGLGNPLQFSCPENPMDRGAWRATVRGVTESDMTEATDPRSQ